MIESKKKYLHAKALKSLSALDEYMVKLRKQQEEEKAKEEAMKEAVALERKQLERVEQVNRLNVLDNLDNQVSLIPWRFYVSFFRKSTIRLLKI